LQGKSLNTVLLAIIAVLTLALAVMSIFLFTTLNSKGVAGVGKAKLSAEQVVPPAEQARFNLYQVDAKGEVDTEKSGDAVFNIKSTENQPNSFLMASISVVYNGGSKNKLLEERKKLLQNLYISDFRQAAIEYFRSKSYDELQQADAMQKAGEDLQAIFSGIIGEDPEDPAKKIILKIVFDKWIIQQQ